MWGMQITPSSQRAVPFGVRALPCKGPEDFGKLKPVDASAGALGEQLEALLDIRRRVGPEPPMVSTIFAPMMTATFMLPGGRDAVIAMMREHPQALEAGLSAIGKTLADYARICVQAGLDGVFYATTVATRALMSVEQCRRFQRAYDLPILQAAAGAPFNIMHVCQDDTLFDEFVDYPVQVFSWATTRGNPSLAEARRKTGKAVLGGLPAKPEIGQMKAEELVKIAHRSIAETGGRHHLLGPGCSINPDTPEELMRAVGKAVAGS
jgi:uroporphyrinogen decarboxylase